MSVLFDVSVLFNKSCVCIVWCVCGFEGSSMKQGLDYVEINHGQETFINFKDVHSDSDFWTAS